MNKTNEYTTKKGKQYNVAFIGDVRINYPINGRLSAKRLLAFEKMITEAETITNKKVFAAFLNVSESDRYPNITFLFKL